MIVRYIMKSYTLKRKWRLRNWKDRERYPYAGPRSPSITPRDEEDEGTETQSPKTRFGKNPATACSIFGRLGDCLLKYCPVALPGWREEQSGSEADSEISVSGQRSVYPSVCLSVYVTVKLSLSANSSRWAECKQHGGWRSRERAGCTPLWVSWAAAAPPTCRERERRPRLCFISWCGWWRLHDRYIMYVCYR